MEKPLVSIIVPVYNVEKYIQSCISSIVCQSYSNLEIILVDDGSTDKSGYLCDEIAKKDNRINVIHQQNQGLSGARNSGIDIARGEYLFFVDSDDFLSVTTIEYLEDTARHNKADIVVCDYVRCKDSDSFDSFIINQRELEFEVIDERQRMRVFLTESKIKVVAWGKLYKRVLFEKVRFPVGRYNEDNFTTYKLVHLAKTIVVTNYIGYVYRISSSSITQQKFKLKHWDDVVGKIEQLHFIEENYPTLKREAQAAVIYACNQVLFLMGASDEKVTELLIKMKDYYRSYEGCYLRSSANLTGKLFSIVAYLNPSVALHFSKFLKKYV